MGLELIIQEADGLLFGNAGSDLGLEDLLVVGPAVGEVVGDGELYLGEGHAARVELVEFFGPVLVGNNECFVEEDDSGDGLRWRNYMNGSFIDESSIDSFFCLDDHDVDPRVLTAERKGEVEVPDGFTSQGDVLVEASLEHHGAVVDVLHAALLGEVDQLPEADDAFV